MKRLISALLIAFMFLACVSMTISAQRDLSGEEVFAQELKELGLFRGVSETDFALGRAPTRVEALVMLIRVLGKENEVTEGVWRHPFTDVPKWADKYVGYAYSNALTNGQSQTEFGTGNANAAMYITFVLRALGYSDKNGEDFVWNNPFTLARETGIVSDGVDLENFLRADVVIVSHAALSSYINGSQQTLAEKLVKAGVFTQNQYNRVYNSGKNSAGTPTVNGALSAEEIYEKCSPAVFYIELYDADKECIAFGSGFFIDDKGTAVTNYHVIDQAYYAKIQLPGSEKMYDVVGVYDYSEKEDWAVIAVDIEDNEYLEIAEDSSIVGGAVAYAIGSPKGLQNTISEGLISNPKRELDGISFIQISTPISPGSSGGALLNEKGKVIGITSAGFLDGQNLNLAIPMSYLEGHKTEAAFSLKRIIEARIAAQEAEKKEESEEDDEEPLAMVNPTAYSVLKGFIKKYHQSVDEELGKEYSVIVYKSDDIARVFSLIYNEEIDYISVRITNLSSEGYSFEHLFSINPNIGITGVTFKGKQDTHNAGIVDLCEGVSVMLCQEFNKDYDFEFIDYYGMELEDTEEITKGMIDEGLNYLNYMFKTFLWEVDEFSVKDLGYITYEPFFEGLTSDEEFDVVFSDIDYYLDKESVTVCVGEQASVVFECDFVGFPDDSKVIVECVDEGIAKAYWGNTDDYPWEIIIEGVSAGNTTLIVSNTFNYETVEIPVTVIPSATNENYFLSSKDIQLGVGGSTVITFNYFDDSLPANTGFYVESSDENVAEVEWLRNSYAWKIVVKGKAKGNATLTVGNDYNKDIITANVTVK